MALACSLRYRWFGLLLGWVSALVVTAQPALAQGCPAGSVVYVDIDGDGSDRVDLGAYEVPGPSAVVLCQLCRSYATHGVQLAHPGAELLGSVA